MEPWTVGLIAVIVIGLAVIVFGALSDRAKNKRAAVEMLAPPQRTIPHFQPDSPAPAYLSELQARRPPDEARSTELTPREREELAGQLENPSTVRINAGYLSRDFVTDQSSSRAVLDAPYVLVCSDRVESTRELVGLLEQVSLSRTPLVVVAPSLSDEVRGTLEVNAIRQTMKLLAVTLASSNDLQRVADLTGAQLRSRSDLQAGYVWPEHLGTCRRWVGGDKASYVVGPGRPDHAP